MAEKDYAPLSTACVRALGDKIYDKRKAAALEIEKMVKDFAAVSNTTQIKKLLDVLGQEFAMSQNPNCRKGGLIGLAATAIALGKDSSVYLEELTKPILASFSDTDARVRYFACEALYNIVKVSRGHILPFFNDIFQALSKLAADPDQNVRNGAELMDRLVKDIVTETSLFDLESFVPLLRERVYTKNPHARQFVVAWIGVLDAVPDIDMMLYLPEFLDGLFQMLSDPNQEIKKTCETVLGEFLHNIIRNPHKADFPAMTNILVTHALDSDPLLQLTALIWLKEFISLSSRTMLPFTSGILTAVLPSLSNDQGVSNRNIQETAKAMNSSMMKLVTVEDDAEDNTGLDTGSLVGVLMKFLNGSSGPTQLAVLNWIQHLLSVIPRKTFRHMEEIFPELLKVLSNATEEVTLLTLDILAEVSSSDIGQKKENIPHKLLNESKEVRDLMGQMSSLSPYFLYFMAALLASLRKDGHLLIDRGSLIIRRLCILLQAENVYRCMSVILLQEKNAQFATKMVQLLNDILLTSTELFQLRSQLRILRTKANLRLQLLEETDAGRHLVSALYGLLMLLPQTEAFHALRRRLECIPRPHGPSRLDMLEKTEASMKEIPFDSLLQHFLDVQGKQQAQRLLYSSSPLQN
ncbi:unnamed protein product [Darwinula stevensoni]|uniref:Protein VAC14 homolog n=1 Tax=Darwinula stevensoni TaxID=69355 RepID=A0A7R9ABI4_9CRUS|nr:unnamed protein product [Darwinula stevensoni]CAG0898988.1 unnamed protein product [Darwinula stevensoni]